MTLSAYFNYPLAFCKFQMLRDLPAEFQRLFAKSSCLVISSYVHKVYLIANIHAVCSTATQSLSCFCKTVRSYKDYDGSIFFSIRASFLEILNFVTHGNSIETKHERL